MPNDPVPDEETLLALEDLFSMRIHDFRTGNQINDALIEAYQRGKNAQHKTKHDIGDGIGLVEKFQADGNVEKFLTGGGKTLAEVCSPDHWNCHTWDNCPTAAAYGVHSFAKLPPEMQQLGRLFIALFDANLLRNPLDPPVPITGEVK